MVCESGNGDKIIGDNVFCMGEEEIVMSVSLGMGMR